jgi:hypothetical protein
MFRVDKLQTQLKTGDNIRMKSFDREYIGSRAQHGHVFVSVGKIRNLERVCVRHIKKSECLCPCP